MLKNALGVLCVAGCLGACAHHGTSVAERERRSEATLRMNDDTASARVGQTNEMPYGTVSDDAARDESVRAETMPDEITRGEDVAVSMPERKDRPSRFASTGQMLPAGEPARSDDTGVNVRDRADQTVTPMDQGNSQADTDLTARIRKALMADDALSFDAKNAKIITQNGHVTLRGSVKSMTEKQTIGRAASNLAGTGHVTNDLEVAR